MEEQIEAIRKKIWYAYHKTRLTEDIYIALSAEEVEDLLAFIEGKK